jgi:hypothetical protein
MRATYGMCLSLNTQTLEEEQQMLTQTIGNCELVVSKIHRDIKYFILKFKKPRRTKYLMKKVNKLNISIKFINTTEFIKEITNLNKINN